MDGHLDIVAIRWIAQVIFISAANKFIEESPRIENRKLLFFHQLPRLYADIALSYISRVEKFARTMILSHLERLP